jgi:hypothetical protein
VFPIRIDYEQGFVDLTQHAGFNDVWDHDFKLYKNGVEFTFEELVENLLLNSSDEDRKKIIESVQNHGLDNILTKNLFNSLSSKVKEKIEEKFNTIEFDKENDMANEVFNKVYISGDAQSLTQISVCLQSTNPTRAFLELLDDMVEWDPENGEKYSLNEHGESYPTYNYVTEVLGAKWVMDFQTDDISIDLENNDGTVFFSCVSAWNACREMFENLEKKFGVSVDAEFEDEFWNFIGVYDGQGYFDLCPDDYFYNDDDRKDLVMDWDVVWERFVNASDDRLSEMESTIHAQHEFLVEEHDNVLEGD